VAGGPRPPPAQVPTKTSLSYSGEELPTLHQLPMAEKAAKARFSDVTTSAGANLLPLTLGLRPPRIMAFITRLGF